MERLPLEVKYRKATHDDILGAIDFCEEFFKATNARFGQGCSELDLREFMLYLVIYEYVILAEIDGEIVGCMAGKIDMNQLKHDEQAFHEIFWYVKPKYRASRIGKTLYNMMIKDMKKKGIRFIIMTNRAEDTSLEKFYFYEDFQMMEKLWIRKI